MDETVFKRIERMKMDGDRWWWMKVDGDGWKCMKMDENWQKLMVMDEGGCRDAKSIKIAQMHFLAPKISTKKA